MALLDYALQLLGRSELLCSSHFLNVGGLLTLHLCKPGRNWSRSKPPDRITRTHRMNFCSRVRRRELAYYSTGRSDLRSRRTFKQMAKEIEQTMLWLAHRRTIRLWSRIGWSILADRRRIAPSLRLEIVRVYGEPKSDVLRFRYFSGCIRQSVLEDCGPLHLR
jgi:hypothetical protein